MGNDPCLIWSCEQLSKVNGDNYRDGCCIRLRSGSTVITTNHLQLHRNKERAGEGVSSAYCNLAVFQCWFFYYQQIFFCVKGRMNICLAGLLDIFSPYQSIQIPIYDNYRFYVKDFLT